MEEPKMRGAPANEVPKNPFLRKRMQEAAAAQEGKSDARPKPHNAVEEALQQAPAPSRHDEEEGEQRKVAIVTGGSSGIGKAVALHLASSNYNVMIVARRKEPLHEVEQELAKYKVKVLVRECDVTKPEQVHDAVAHAAKAFGRIDVLVNCAGYGLYGDLEAMSLKDINGQMLTNYFGTVLFIKESLPRLREHHGVIVNVASLAGLVGAGKMAAYSASKHAVVGLSESLRFELDGSGVSVSCVCPGKVHTDFFKNESFKGVPYAEDAQGISPNAVAHAVDKAIHERRFLYTVPAGRRWQVLLGRLLPESFVKARVKSEMRQA